jgi:multisubunit Na+/H+ antiporter MnhB subunit
MSGPPGAFDWTLALAIPALALAAVASRDLVRAVALFVVLGLVLALAWARLGAPDVALAEAALGSGITGVLLVSALGRLGGADVRAKGPLRSALAGALAVAAVAGAVRALLAPPPAEPGLRDAVLARVGETGAAHPVTAVLLDFRGYDTLLEIAVLLLAVLGVRAARGGAPAPPEAPPGPILGEGVKTVAPMIVLVAGYVLWAGATAPGGAFQAGTALGAGAVLAALSGALGPRPGPRWLPRVLLAAGYAVFLGVAAGTLGARGALLDFPAGHAGALLLAIETGLTVTIAIVVRELFAGCSPPPPERG